MPPLICTVLLLGVPGPALSTAVLVAGGAAAVGGFRIPRPNRVALYSILAISLVVASGHLWLLVIR
jgi:hypothetical protein